MRLWHQDIISKLPRQQLLGQHRECCALRGAGWGRPHATVNYVFRYPPYKLVQYHLFIMEEMKRRGYQPAGEWFDPSYRGKSVAAYIQLPAILTTYPLYAEHDSTYLAECIDNLKSKGIQLELT